MKKHIYSVLEKVVVKLVIYLMRVSSGFATFLVTTVAERGFEHLIVPALNGLLREGLYVYDKTAGQIRSNRFLEARDSDDEDYDAAVDVILH